MERLHPLGRTQVESQRTLWLDWGAAGGLLGRTQVESQRALIIGMCT